MPRIGSWFPKILFAAALLASGAVSADVPARLIAGAMANFTPLSKPIPAPEVSFVDGKGGKLSLADFRGKVLFINFWATWCAPCRREMPDIAALQKKFGSDHFEVLAISGDRQGPSVVQPFYDDIGVKNLAIYNDRSMRTHRAFRVIGLPTTVIVDAEGLIIGQLIGPAEWANEEAFALVGHLVGDAEKAKGDGASTADGKADKGGAG